MSASSVACPSLRLLHITDNSLKDWAEVRKFGSMFPSLDTLVMANNNLASIQDSKDILPRLFPNLRSINLHNSGRWDLAMRFNGRKNQKQNVIRNYPNYPKSLLGSRQNTW